MLTRCVSCCSLVWLVLIATAAAWAGEAASEMPPVRNARLNFVCELPTTPDGAKSLDLWIPMPQDNERQTVRLLNENDLGAGRITTEKKFGNRLYYRHFDLPLTGADAGSKDPAKIELVYDVTVREATVPEAKKLVSTRQVEPGPEFAPYLGDVKMIPIKGKISAVASVIDMPEGEPLRAARKVYDYLIDTMVYNYKAPGAGIGDAVWACDSRTGDCSDYNSVFIGVCRWRGIPADHVFGMPMPPGKPEGDMKFCHCWARFWVADVGWIPIDPSRADKFPDDREYYFGTLGSTWVILAHGRDVVLEPPQQGPPLNMLHGPVAEIDGKPVEKLQWVCHYKDHPNTAAK